MAIIISVFFILLFGYMLIDGSYLYIKENWENNKAGVIVYSICFAFILYFAVKILIENSLG